MNWTFKSYLTLFIIEFIFLGIASYYKTNNFFIIFLIGASAAAVSMLIDRFLYQKLPKKH